MICIVMGVSGCGKTSVGQELARRLEYDFAEGDEFHSPENVAKMASGQPLDDDDREPWLQTMAKVLEQYVSSRKSLVLACSALKRRYRDILRTGHPEILFIHLHGTFELIGQRIDARSDHYMPSSLLVSQFDALESPGEDEWSIAVPVDKSLDEIVDTILENLPLSSG